MKTAAAILGSFLIGAGLLWIVLCVGFGIYLGFAGIVTPNDPPFVQPPFLSEFGGLYVLAIVGLPGAVLVALGAILIGRAETKAE